MRCLCSLSVRPIFQLDLNEAKGSLEFQSTQAGSVPVVAILSSVDPGAKRYKEAMALLLQIC